MWVHYDTAVIITCKTDICPIQHSDGLRIVVELIQSADVWIHYDNQCGCIMIDNTMAIA